MAGQPFMRLIKKKENLEFTKVCIKNRASSYFNGIIKSKDFDLDNVLTDEKSHENILILIT